MASNPPAPVPVAERIIARLIEVFSAVTNLGGEEGLIWEQVIDAPITDKDRSGMTKSILSIQAGREVHGTVSMAEDKFLDVSFEFEIKTYVGERPSTFLNYVLADIQKTLTAHSQLDGLCLHVKATGSDRDVDGSADRTVGGIVFATIHYRHMYGDPCRLIGE